MGHELPKALFTREITIDGFTMRRHVLDDGRAVVEGEDMDRLFAAMQAGTLSLAAAEAFLEWGRGGAA